MSKRDQARVAYQTSAEAYIRQAATRPVTDDEIRKLATPLARYIERVNRLAIELAGGE